jgi:uncharacterized protein YutE (UPF0331/DUF86 family)
MNGLQFVASVINSLSWPATAFAIAFLLRRSLGRMLTGDIRRWKAGPAGLEVEFQEKAAHVQQEVKEIQKRGPAAPEASKEESAFSAQMLELAKVSPRAAIMEIYAHIIDHLRLALVMANVAEAKDIRDAYRLMYVAEERKAIPADTLKAIKGLAALRNIAAHGQADLSYERAVEFLRLSEPLLWALMQPPKKR